MQREERQKEWRFLPTGSQNVGAGSYWPPVTHYSFCQSPELAMPCAFQHHGKVWAASSLTGDKAQTVSKWLRRYIEGLLALKSQPGRTEWKGPLHKSLISVSRWWIRVPGLEVRSETFAGLRSLECSRTMAQNSLWLLLVAVGDRLL